ncbi:hypothetical protein ABTM13_19185, partial [Acinetobacter baumannii]
PDGRHPLGGAALLVDGTTPRVVYQDEATVDLESAAPSGAGWSQKEVAAGPAGAGFFARVIKVGTTVYAAHLVYDRQMKRPFQRVHIDPVP